MDFSDRIGRTIEHLRNDLRDLKRCQVQYFVLSITATGALLGLTGNCVCDNYQRLVVLTPLGLLIPCWLIFFDKATTITRIIGYQRVLEELLCEATRRGTPDIGKPEWFIGFESAVAHFRWMQDKGDLDKLETEHKVRFRKVLALKTRHRFWMLNWYTFCVLSLLCCGLGYTSGGDKVYSLSVPPPFSSTLELSERDISLLALGVVLAVAFYTFVVVVQLVQGSHSMDHNSQAWRLVLENPPGWAVPKSPGKDT